MNRSDDTDDPAPPSEEAKDSAVSRLESQPRVRLRAASHRFEHLQLPERYELREELGRGGMGAVYRAYDRREGHEVALKVLYGFSAEDRLRLKSEFRALQNIVHPNLVNLYDLVIDERSCFFTMELIRGRDFASYIRHHWRSTLDPDERDAFFTDVTRQLTLALNALHTDGKLHRDVKPSNVLVTEAGRVVLLDFGLVSSSTRSSLDQANDLGGTLQYMSPEQIWEQPLSPASDWYSFGLTLYEALTGNTPNRLELLSTTSTANAPSVRVRGVEIREDVDQLIQRLLSKEPSQRPNASEILHCFGGSPPFDVTGSIRPREHHELVGRGEQLARLLQLFDEIAEPGLRVVRVFGPSGIGKSALIRAFFEDLSARPKTLLLRSRCHPQEALAFNALDGFIDELAREVPSCLGLQARQLPPQQHRALIQVFPVLAKALELEAPSLPSEANERERRQLAFDAVCELLRRLSADWRIVVWLDDVQWGDEDSGVFLRDLLRAQNRPHLLLIASYRAEDEDSSRCLRVLREAPELWDTTTAMNLEPLDDSASSELLRNSVGRSWHEDPAVVERLLRTAGGSPFFLGELGRHLSGSDAGEPRRDIGLEELLRERTSRLPSISRTVLEVLAVAGAPLEQSTALSAAGLPSSERGRLADLERLSILRTTDVGQHKLEFYHDRLREAVLRELSDGDRRRHHKAIAGALLSTTRPNPLVAIEHYEAAWDLESVRRYIIHAANHALDVLAFQRAAQLFQRAIELRAEELPNHELHRRLGVALGNAGYGKEAGEAYLAAATLLKSEPNARAEEIVRLQQLAAEQFIQTGHFTQGMDAIRDVMKGLGIHFPKSQGDALRRAMALRLKGLITGVKPRKRKQPPSAEELLRFDVLWSTNIRLAMVDFSFTSYATARCAADSLALAEPSRMICALSLESTNWTILPGKIFRKHAEKLTGAAEALSRVQSTPYDQAFMLAAGAVAACFRGEFRRVVEDSDRAIATLRAASSGRQWEEGLWEMWSMIGLTHLGEMRKLVERAEAIREDARRRDDRFIALNASLGRPSTTWLVRNRPDTAIAEADRALAWTRPGYTTQHYQHYVSTAEARLHKGEPDVAWAMTLETWKAHEKNSFLSIHFVRDELLHTRARLAVALARNAQQKGSEANLDSLRADATKAAESMRRHALKPAEGWSLLVRAALAHQTSMDALALDLLERAVEVFDECEMQLYREAARARLGHLQGLERGTALQKRAVSWMHDQGIEDPDAMLRMLAPGFHL